MGTDIHLFVEYREPSPVLGIPGPWKPAHVSELSLPRYYELFNLLGGARGGDPVHPNRGFPDDMSRHVGRKMRGYHSETWLTRDEFATICRDFYEGEDLLTGIGTEVIIEFMDSLRFDGYESRIIIAFDS